MQYENSKKIIGYWLLLGVAMLIIQIVLGGVTRLTGSGLSITEWKPILGALPPFSDAEWQIAFDKYKTIAQYKYLNQDFELHNFKFIYFWEWLHRNWGRFIGIVFLIPFFYFLKKKWIEKALGPKLIILFALGLGQGLIGWIMVASGLNDENLYVSHIRLAIHFISALILISVNFWFALELIIAENDKQHLPKIKQWNFFILSILFFQLIYGAFMAGLKAGNAASTWPTINGDYIPSSIYTGSIFSHPISVHFIHRGLAYLLFFVVAFWFYKIMKGSFNQKINLSAKLALGFIFIQVLLGIFTVLNAPKALRNSFGVFESFAQLHQFVALLFLLTILWNTFLLIKKDKE
ncbi:MAG: COX15/CtaA family protein [Chitinophagaceae bacterium]|nr:COX15/CtaA family protein [Chitinophagaceae bacterium]